VMERVTKVKMTFFIVVEGASRAVWRGWPAWCCGFNASVLA
jgi:hypothetical protein